MDAARTRVEGKAGTTVAGPVPSPYAPAVRTAGLVIFAAGAFAILRGLGTWWGVDAALRGGYGFWAGVAAVSSTTWCVVFAVGVGRLRNLPKHARPSTRWYVVSCVLLVVIASGAAFVLRAITVSVVAVPPISGLNPIIGILTVLGWVAAAPWLFLLWLGAARTERLRSSTASRCAPPTADDYDPSAIDGAALRSAGHELDEIWGLIERSALALGLLLTTLVLNTTVLRLVRLAAGADEAAFPAWSVIGYGLFFAVLLAAVLVPQLMAWRDIGYALVIQALPAPRSGIPSEGQAAALDRFLAAHGLDRSLLRHPVTSLSVLAPAVVAFASSLLPLD